MSESAQNTPRTWDQPEGSSFEQWMESRVARFSTRKYDFDALKFQADFDPKYRRGQMRYIGTGGVMLSTGRFGIVARQGPQFFFKTLETEIDAESCLVVQEQRADRRQFYRRAGVHERQLGGVTGGGHRRQDRAVQASGHYTTVTGVGHAGSHPQLV